MVEFELAREPEQGLGPQNQLWRRWVVNSLTELSRGFRNFRNDITNSFRAVNSSMGKLSGQVVEIQTLANDTATLTSDLGDVVSDLSDAVDDIEDLAEGKLVPATSSIGGSGFLVNSTYPNVLSTSIPIPAGYTRAIVMLTGGVTTGTTSSGGDILSGRSAIHGITGQEMRALCTTGTPAATVSISQSSYLTGLVPGGSVVGVIAAKLDIGNSGGLIGSTGMLSMTAIFMV